MMKKIVSALLSVALVAGGVYAYYATRTELEYYTVSADIEQAPNLFAGGRVMVRGVEVGEIADVVPDETGVTVTMRIEEGVDIPADAQLSVVPITVISDRYVQFTPAYTSGPTLQDGDHLAATRTSIPAELDDVLKQLKELLATVEPKKDEKRGPIAKLVRDVDFILKGKVGDLRGSIQNSASFLNNLARSSNEINGLIRNLDELFITLAGRRSEIGLVNERFKLVAESLEGDRKDLEGTIENITLLSNEARRLFAQSGDDLGAALKSTETVIYGVLEHQEAIAEGFRWTNVIAQALGATDGSGKGLFAYTGKQVPPGAPGAEYNYRLDTRDTIACERLQALKDSLAGSFGTDPDLIYGAILAFTPEKYHEDLSYVFRLLLPRCTDLDPDRTQLFGGGARADRAIQKAIAKVGEERFREVVGIWLLQTISDLEPVKPKRRTVQEHRARRSGS